MSTDDTPHPDEWVVPADEAEAPAAQAPGPRNRFGGAAKMIAPVVAALLVGGGAVFAIDHNSGSSASGAPGGSRPAFGNLGSASSTGGGPGGGVAGEQRLQGTVTAVTGSTVTIVSSSGRAATYTVNATSQVMVNGKTASLSAVKKGDKVFVHVYPSSSGAMLVERLFDGALPSGGPGFGAPPSGDGTGAPDA